MQINKKVPKNTLPYGGAQMQIGCANHRLKMSGIPMIRTGSEREDKTNISVAVLMTRPTFGASSRSQQTLWFLFRGLIVFAVHLDLRAC
jgi:hypothetical protein